MLKSDIESVILRFIRDNQDTEIRHVRQSIESSHKIPADDIRSAFARLADRGVISIDSNFNLILQKKL